MNLEIINKEEYDKFAFNSPYISIYQYPSWGELKKTNGWDYYLLGLKDNDVIKGVTLLLRKKVLGNLYLFYAPRGYLVDAKNNELLTMFHNKIIDFVKKNKGFMVKIDPNIIYNLKDKDGNLIAEVGHNEFNNYLKLGYKHYGFNLNFETLQPRFLCRYKIQDNYEDTLKTFSKSTIKNTEKSIAMGVLNRKLNLDEVNLFVDQLRLTAENKHFVVRPTSYYKKMLELFPNNVVYYLTYLDTNKYLEYVNNEIKNDEINIKEINDKINKYANVGEKLKHELQINESKLDKDKLELKEAIELNNKDKFITLGSLMSVFVGNEGITFMSGTNSNYKKFYIKYSFYNEHLKESIKRKMEYVNFYGISGNLDPKSEYYNIYDIKKGYNPEILELLGEFDYVINKPKYNLYKFILWAYKISKKIRN
jgi:lipid II:glycine glycyltransferase (peptidoglycan interpeptide bridge formation enzyme)